MSLAIPKSPILATRLGPVQLSRQFRAAMSLKKTQRREKKSTSSKQELGTFLGFQGREPCWSSPSQGCSSPMDEVILLKVVAALRDVLGQLQQVLHDQR